MVRRFWTDEDAVTSVEYALLLAVMVVASIRVWTDFAATIRDVIRAACAAIDTAGHV